MDPKIKQKVNGFFKEYKFRVYKKGKYLIKSGEKPKGIFCLQKGIVRSMGLLNNGTEVTINLFRPISFFPTNWVINNKLELYNYEALTDVEVYIAPKRNFKSFIKENPIILLDLLKRIYRGLEGYQLRIESLLSNNDYYKVLVQILISTKRFGEKNENGEYLFRLDKDEISSLTGLSETRVAKVIRELTKKNILKYDKENFVVKNPELLEYETFLST